MNKSTLFPQVEPEGWKAWCPEMLQGNKVVFLLGGVDTGKTYLARFLYEKTKEAGLKSAILELDVGQSEFGPPLTCTLFMDGLSRKHYFIGKFSPQGVFWRCLTAGVLLKKEAEKLGPDLVIVDTTGLVEGPPGVWLKCTKIELLRPDLILARSRSTELEPILGHFSFRKDIKIIRDAVPPQIRCFSSKERAILREQKLRHYFRNSQEYVIPRDKVALLPNPDSFERISQRGGLIVGLIDGNGWLLALAILIEKVRSLRLFAPSFPVQELACIEPSSIRTLDPESFIIGKERP